MRAGTNSGDQSHCEKKKREMRARRGGKRDSEVETARQREGEEGRGGERGYTGRFMASCLEHTAETDS